MLETSLAISLTVFLIILIPIYTKTYGLQNFLWLSDIGLFLTFFGLWLKSSLLISMAALGIFPFELVWAIDFFIHLATGHSFLAISDYMFDPKLSKMIRALSLFHLVMPIIWIWFLFKWGYNNNAVFYQTALVWLILLVTYFFTDKTENINWVFFPYVHHWKKIPSYIWLLLMLIIYPLIIFFPMHALLKRFF